VCFQFRRDATIRRRRCILMHLDAPWRPSFPAWSAQKVVKNMPISRCFKMFQDVSRTLWSKTWDKCIETSLVRPRPVCCAVPGLPVAAMDQKRLCEDLRCDMMCSCFFRFLQHPSAVHAFAYQPWPVDWWHIVEFLNWWKRETTNILESSWVYNVPISSYFILFHPISSYFILFHPISSIQWFHFVRISCAAQASWWREWTCSPREEARAEKKSCGFVTQSETKICVGLHTLNMLMLMHPHELRNSLWMRFFPSKFTGIKKRV
jgi:hypothetical protein